MSSIGKRSFCALGACTALAILLAAGGARVWGASSSVADAVNVARHALDAVAVQAFDGSITFLKQTDVEAPVGGAVAEINDKLAGPGAEVESSVEYRIYKTPADAVAHSNPDLTQQRAEANQNDMPHGSFRTYHSNLSGSGLAQEVPQTFRCMALVSKGHWSRCYYYPGGESTTVVVGTTTSDKPNEAILITAMGAQPLAK